MILQMAKIFALKGLSLLDYLDLIHYWPVKNFLILLSDNLFFIYDFVCLSQDISLVFDYLVLVVLFSFLLGFYSLYCLLLPCEEVCRPKTRISLHVRILVSFLLVFISFILVVVEFTSLSDPIEPVDKSGGSGEPKGDWCLDSKGRDSNFTKDEQEFFDSLSELGYLGEGEDSALTGISDKKSGSSAKSIVKAKVNGGGAKKVSILPTLHSEEETETAARNLAFEEYVNKSLGRRSFREEQEYRKFNYKTDRQLMEEYDRLSADPREIERRKLLLKECEDHAFRLRHDPNYIDPYLGPRVDTAMRDFYARNPFVYTNSKEVTFSPDPIIGKLSGSEDCEDMGSEIIKKRLFESQDSSSSSSSIISSNQQIEPPLKSAKK